MAKETQKTIFNEKYKLLITQIVQLRKDKGLTQRDMAVRLNVPHCYIARTEICERRLDILELIEIFRVLEVPQNEILTIIESLF
ncbi:transcriptional regulator [Campylobacterota bacterium]|nr:transcriptional regulator [Campylobacterota bacterium]